MASAKYHIIANWKLFPGSLEEAKQYFSKNRKVSVRLKNVKLVICPPAVFLLPLSRLLTNARGCPELGAQDVSFNSFGPHTGEISSKMILDVGASYVIVGHSERRIYDSNLAVSKKAATAANEGLKVIVCVGENKRDDQGDYLSFLKTQIEESLAGFPIKHLDDLFVAYEPVWAIGRDDDPVSVQNLLEMSIYVKKILNDVFGGGGAAQIKILYGGAVNENNAGVILSLGGFAGLLVGHNSLNFDNFKSMLSVVDFTK